MASTQIYGWVFILPNMIKQAPIQFGDFKKPLNEEGEEQGYYTYDEYTSLSGNAPVDTPSGTHKILGTRVTSSGNVKGMLQANIDAIAPNLITVLDGAEDSERFTDEDQSKYLWVLYVGKNIDYGYDAFKEVSPLFKEPEIEEVNE